MKGLSVCGSLLTRIITQIWCCQTTYKLTRPSRSRRKQNRYTATQPSTSIRKQGSLGQVNGYRRTHRAVTGVGSRFSTTVFWSVFPVKVWIRKHIMEIKIDLHTVATIFQSQQSNYMV